MGSASFENFPGQHRGFLSSGEHRNTVVIELPKGHVIKYSKLYRAISGSSMKIPLSRKIEKTEGF